MSKVFCAIATSGLISFANLHQECSIGGKFKDKVISAKWVFFSMYAVVERSFWVTDAFTTKPDIIVVVNEDAMFGTWPVVTLPWAAP